MERVTPASSPFQVDVRFDLGAKGALPALTSNLNQAAADSSPHSITAYAAKGRDRDAGYHDSDLADESDDERVFGVVSSALVSSRGDSQDSDTPPFARRWKNSQQQQEQTQMTPILHDTTPEPGTPQLTPRTKEIKQAQRSNSPQPQLDDKSDTASPTRAKSSAPEPVAEEEKEEQVEVAEEEMMEVEEQEEDSRSPPPRKRPPRGSSKASHEAADSEGALHRGRGRSVEKVTNWRSGVELADGFSAADPASAPNSAAVASAREEEADPPAVEDDASESLKEEADLGTVQERTEDVMQGAEVGDEEPPDEEAVIGVAEVAEAVEEDEAAAEEELEQEAVDDVAMLALDFGGGSPVEEQEMEEEGADAANEEQEEEADTEESAPAPVAPVVRPTRRRHTEPVAVKPAPVTPQPKRRGRPPGSKNKSKQSRQPSPESVPSSVASSSSSEPVQSKRRALAPLKGRRRTLSPTLVKAKTKVTAAPPAPSSSGRPQRSRRSSDNWWDIGRALKLNEVSKRKVFKPVSEEEEESVKPRRGRPRAKPRPRDEESDDAQEENDEDEVDDSPKAKKRRGRPPSALKKTPVGATPNKRVRINAPPAKQQEPTPSPSPPRAPSPKKKKIAPPKPPRTAPTVLAKGSGPGWAEGGGWDNLREVGGIDEFSD